MRFNQRARLDTSQVRDRRGSGRGGRGGPVIAGGGGLGLVGLLIVLAFSMLGGGEEGVAPAGVPVAGPALQERCRTGADAQRNEDCRLVAVVNSVQGYWQEEFRARDWDYRPATTNVFTGGVNTGCGAASSSVGPFYCPADQQIYLDLGFFDQLVTRFGASGGDFGEAYVIAHEYAHHVQNLLGISDTARRSSIQQGAEGASVRLELQADCLAGVWAGRATTIPTADTGEPLLLEVSQQDIREGLDAAAAVGDDRIQEQTQGRADPESFTHGTAEQRQRWFLTGYQSQDLAACDTFATEDLG